MPYVLHLIIGVNCSGRVVAAVEGSTVELCCDRCGAVVGVVQVGIMEGLLGLDCTGAICPHCGSLNTLPDCTEVNEYVCGSCGRRVET
jgi:hypothetical protein